MEQSKQETGWLKRLGWLVLIWSLSVAALGVVSYGIRLLMHAAGLTAH